MVFEVMKFKRSKYKFARVINKSDKRRRVWTNVFSSSMSYMLALLFASQVACSLFELKKASQRPKRKICLVPWRRLCSMSESASKLRAKTRGRTGVFAMYDLVAYKSPVILAECVVLAVYLTHPIFINHARQASA